jgi:fatty acid desaturase
MVAFNTTWNLTAGVALLIPSFLYESHLAHHNTHHYGTGNDGEYLPLGVGPLRNILGFLGQILLLPIFVFVRFLIIAPISFLNPRLRQFVLERMSSFVVNFSYRRAIPDNAPRKVWAAMEVLCFLRAAALVGSVLGGFVPWTRLIDVYLLAMLALGLNHVRTLVAHRYLSSGKTMSHAEQVDDSLNITGSPLLGDLLFPVGLRYHALHHAFPSLPYHNLGIAHRRLVAKLPADSPYHRTNMRGIREALGELIKSSREACALPPPPADAWYARRKAMRSKSLTQLYGSDEETVDAPVESPMDSNASSK